MAKLLHNLVLHLWQLLLLLVVTSGKPLIDSFYGSNRDLKVEHTLEKPFFVEDHLLAHGRWTFNGSKSLEESVHENFIRLVGGHPNEFGSMWNSAPVTVSNWEADVEFRIHGIADLSGYGDGLIFWFSQNKIQLTGPIFSSITENAFSGFAIVVETADPKTDKKDSIYAMIKNGALEYGDDTQTKFPGCSHELRNSHSISKLRIQVERNVLTVWIATEEEGKEKLQWHGCLKVGFHRSNDIENDHYYLGLSASTGPSSLDYHDIWAVKTYQLIDLNDSAEEPDVHRELSYYERPSRPGFETLSGHENDASNNYLVLPLLVFLIFVLFGVFGLSISNREELDT